MITNRVLLAIAALVILPPAIFAQGPQQEMHRDVYVVGLENINYGAREEYRINNQKKDAAFEKRKDELQKERQIRDRKVELDIQLMVDTAKIQKKELNEEEIEKEKRKRLELSLEKYEADYSVALQRSTHDEYVPPDQSNRYTITFFSDRFSQRTWYSIFVETGKDVVPFESYEPWLEKSIRMKDNHLEIEIYIKYGEGTQRNIKLPLGIIFAVYTVKF